MEARQTLRGSGVPKGLVIVLAMCAAFGIVLAGSLIAKDFAGSSSAGTTVVHPAPGTVLRQDNPATLGAPLLDRGAERGSAPAVHSGRSTGSTSIQNSDSGFTAYNPGWDAKSVREGHGA